MRGQGVVDVAGGVEAGHQADESGRGGCGREGGGGETGFFWRRGGGGMVGAVEKTLGFALFSGRAGALCRFGGA